MEELHKETEQYGWQKRKMLIGGATVSTLAVVGTLGWAVYEGVSKANRDNARSRAELSHAIEADGFAVEALDDQDIGRERVQLDLGSCSLQDVKLTITRRDGRISDVLDYRFERAGVEYTFANAKGVVRLFGSDPCVTLARDGAPQEAPTPLS